MLTGCTLLEIPISPTPGPTKLMACMPSCGGNVFYPNSKITARNKGVAGAGRPPPYLWWRCLVPNRFYYRYISLISFVKHFSDTLKRKFSGDQYKEALRHCLAALKYRQTEKGCMDSINAALEALPVQDYKNGRQYIQKELVDKIDLWAQCFFKFGRRTPSNRGIGS